MAEHAVEIKPGDWVLLDGDTVVYADPDMKAVLRKAESMPRDNLLITKSLSEGYCFY